MQLSLIALTLLLSTEADTPKRIESITEWNIMEVRHKMAIEAFQKEVAEMKARKRLRAYTQERNKKLTFDERVETALAIQNSSKEFNLPIPLIMAIIEVESSWRPKVIGKAGERGLMQIHPSYVDHDLMFDIKENIKTGAAKLRTELNFSDNDLDKALMEYNGVKKNIKAGKIYITKVRTTMKKIEEFLK